MTALTDGDLERALLLLPSPVFRSRDVYDVAEQLGFQRWMGQSIWSALAARGWIVRTAQPIFGPDTHKFYWERTPR